MKCCINCRHFRDAHYSKTYITPRCSQRGDDDAMWMRAHVCEIDGILFEPKPMASKMIDKEYEEEYLETNWHLYRECDELYKMAELIVAKLHRKDVREHGKKVLEDLYYLRRLCDQNAG